MFKGNLRKQQILKQRSDRLSTYYEHLKTTPRTPNEDSVSTSVGEIHGIVGITATQVELSDDQTLKLDPCFFFPLPDNKMLQAYPIKEKRKSPPPQPLTSQVLVESFISS